MPNPLELDSTNLRPSKFDIIDWLKQYEPLIQITVFVVSLLTFLWVIHKEFTDLNSRVGRVEGKIEIMTNNENERLKCIEEKIEKQ